MIGVARKESKMLSFVFFWIGIQLTIGSYDEISKSE